MAAAKVVEAIVVEVDASLVRVERVETESDDISLVSQMTKKKNQTNYLAKLILVFFVIGAAINIVAQSFSETYHPDLTTALVILIFAVIFSVIILGDKIQDAL